MFPLRVSVTHMWWWIFCSWPPASQLSPCPTSPIWPTVCLIWAFSYCVLVCVCCPVILCTQSRHHLPQSRRSRMHFPNGAAHGCSDSLVLHLFFHASSKNSHTNTDRGGFFIQSKQTTFADKGVHLKSLRDGDGGRGSSAHFCREKTRSCVYVPVVSRVSWW